jgi:hypothetical protein
MAALVTKTKEETDKDGSINKITEIAEYHACDPRCLNQIMHCVERRCKILGLDAPTRINNEEAPRISTGRLPESGHERSRPKRKRRQSSRHTERSFSKAV